MISAGCAIGYRKGAKGGTWIARFRDTAGKQNYEALGAADDARDADGRSVYNFTQAQERARDWFRQKAREEAGEVPADDEDGPYTVARAIADYCSDYLHRGGKAVDRLDWSAAAWILPELGGLPIDRLTKKRIENWHRKIAETPARLRTRPGVEQKHRRTENTPEAVRRRRSTANRVLTILKAALNHAHREGKCVSDDAWRSVRAFREADAARLRYLSDDEARRLTSACPTDFRALVTAALLTGCRYGELAALTAADFNSDSGTLTIRASKSGKSRHVVLTEESQRFFADATAGRASDETIFRRTDGGTWGKSHQHRPLRKSCRVASISPAASFHVLRHTHGSMLAMRGVPMPVIARQLGHADTRMTERHYAHLSPSYVADTIRASFPTLGIVGESNTVPLPQRR